jgi:hypothetical protein
LKKNILSFLLVLTLLLLTNSLNLTIKTYNFNPKEVKNNISYLSSDYFKGRLSGSMENIEVEAFIRNQFKAIGLEPFNSSYYDSFEANYPHRLKEDPFLRVVDKTGAVIKEYRYGTDYREEMLNFKNNYVVFSKNDSIYHANSALQVTKGTDSFLFFVPDGNNLSFRSSFMGNEGRYQSMYIMLNKEVLDELNIYISKNNKIVCYIPFDVRKTTLNNVVGYIKGKDSKTPPIVVSGHFDHLGSDLSGKVYGGALDNASGISFVLEFARYIKSLGIPDRDIIIAAFNAEEFGCLGSTHFVEKYSKVLQGAKVYNFDMIGSSSVPLSIMGAKTDSDQTNFVRSITSTFNKSKISYNYIFEDASDHEAFRKHNIDAITFCDSDMSKIHTPEDRAEYISTEAIVRAFNVASIEVIKYAYSDKPNLLHYKKIFMLSLAAVSLLSLLNNTSSKKHL